jgi:hypothetical protein
MYVGTLSFVFSTGTITHNSLTLFYFINVPATVEGNPKYLAGRSKNLYASLEEAKS